MNILFPENSQKVVRIRARLSPGRSATLPHSQEGKFELGQNFPLNPSIWSRSLLASGTPILDRLSLF